MFRLFSPLSAWVLSGLRRWQWPATMMVTLFTVPVCFAGPAPAASTSPAAANLCYMGLFCSFRSFDQLIKAMMRFMGFSILMASVIGIMVGGLFYIFSAGDESKAQKGKSIIIASVIGLCVFFLSYAIVSLVQSVLYGVGV